MIKSEAWVDVHQPTKIKDCFLPKKTRRRINQLVKSENIPSMIFAGPPGVGKTSLAKAIGLEFDFETLFINASLMGIDEVRTSIRSFATTLAFNGKRKLIILDEGDGITQQAQEALRGSINEYADNAAFIITANFKHKIMEPIHSRLTAVDFNFPREELPDLARHLYAFIEKRLKEESIPYEPKAIQQYLIKSLTDTNDIRKILTGAQEIAKSGEFTLESIIELKDDRLDGLVELVKSKNFVDIRTWVGENPDLTLGLIVKYIYNEFRTFTDAKRLPLLVEIINRHQYQEAFVIDREINKASLLMELSVAL